MPKMLSKRLLMFMTAMMIAAATTVACAPAKAVMGFKNEKVNYRVTVTVDTPEGVKTASAVREAAAYTEPSLLSDQGGTFYNITTGEAVVVDLGARGVVFALLGGQTEAKVVSRAIRLENKTSFDMKPLPPFVYFRDPTDPKTVEAVNPDDFAATFGAGVALKSVTIEVSREPVTKGALERYLPWLLNIKGYIDGQFFRWGA